MNESVKVWIELLAAQCVDRCRDADIYAWGGLPNLERGARGAASMLSAMAFDSAKTNAVSSSRLGKFKRRGEAAALGLSL